MHISYSVIVQIFFIVVFSCCFLACTQISSPGALQQGILLKSITFPLRQYILFIFLQFLNYIVVIIACSSFQTVPIFMQTGLSDKLVGVVDSIVIPLKIHPTRYPSKTSQLFYHYRRCFNTLLHAPSNVIHNLWIYVDIHSGIKYKCSATNSA